MTYRAQLQDLAFWNRRCIQRSSDALRFVKLTVTYACRHSDVGTQKMGDLMKLLTSGQVKLGFIGLGNMGSRIAERLLDHGYQLSVYDRDLGKAEAIAAQGGVVPKNMLELARTSDVLLSCLT